MKGKIEELFRVKKIGYTYTTSVLLWYLWSLEREAHSYHPVILDEDGWKYCKSITGLGRTLGLTQPNVSRQVKRLEAMGLVRKMEVPWQGSEKRVGLTEKGRTMLGHVILGI